jgi:arsenate reductase (thioredoxin)
MKGLPHKNHRRYQGESLVGRVWAGAASANVIGCVLLGLCPHHALEMTACETHEARCADSRMLPIQILFACTHNSARSILAEALLRHHGAGRFVAHSAGSAPRENQQPNPLGIACLKAAGVFTQGLHTKSWDVFAWPSAPRIDAVITLCDSAAGEACPLFAVPPGAPQPPRVHWGYADPSAGEAPLQVKQAAFERTRQAIERRLLALVARPDDALGPRRLASTLRQLADVA